MRATRRWLRADPDVDPDTLLVWCVDNDVDGFGGDP